jgi:hypothetical protein
VDLSITDPSDLNFSIPENSDGLKEHFEKKISIDYKLLQRRTDLYEE